MNDRRLRDALAAEVVKNAPVNRAQCPTPETLQALAASGHVGDNAAQRVVLEHVLSCAHCHPEFVLLRATHNATHERSVGSRRFVVMQRVAMAATLLLAVGISGEWWRRNRQELTRAAPMDRSDVVLIAPTPDDNRAWTGGGGPWSGRLAWRSVEGTVAYHVEILDSASNVVVEAVTSDTVLRLAPADSARVATLRWFDWIVSARRIDGNERRSALTRVGRATERR